MASRSLNKVVLIGNLTRDPELKYTPSGAPVCTFGLATNRSWVTADGQTKEDTQFHRIVAWHKLAELTSKLLTKGKKVYMEGRLSYRSYTGKDGVQRSITEIILDDFIVFSNGKRIESEEAKEEAAPITAEVVGAEEFAQATSPAQVDTTPTREKKSKESQVEEKISPDDIPF